MNELQWKQIQCMQYLKQFRVIIKLLGFPTISINLDSSHSSILILIQYIFKTCYIVYLINPAITII